jgi:hypothetical protein
MRATQLARLASVVAVCGLLVSVTPSIPAVSSAPPGSWAAHDEMLAYKQQHGYLPIGNPPSTTAPAAPTVTPAVGNYQPVAGPSWEGLHQDNLAPPDPTDAMGPKSFIQMINLQMGIYDRNGAAITLDTLQHLTGSNDFLSDPQVIWDPSSNRFYYLVLDAGNDTIFWGFSKDSNPTTLPGSFCNYNADFNWGPSLPDYPKLGQTTDFLLIGVNVYLNIATFSGPDVAWIVKPPNGITSCPSGSSFRKDKKTALKHCDGVNFAATPEPAVQTDPSPVGWIAANPDPTNSGFVGSTLDIFKVTRNADGSANIPSVGTCVNVPLWALPSPTGAPQKGSINLLDTLDARLIHAVSAKDPSHDDELGLWTSHTVLGGGGTEVRWYEIDVVHATLFQTGTVSNRLLHVFNGAISPDRAVNGSSAQFGSSMVLGFTTSSATEYPAIQMLSKVGGNPQSPWVMVKQSPGPDDGFDCFQNFVGKKCRWGDYGGAVPDPIAAAGTPFGKVWLSNEWATAEINPFGATWRTWNWGAVPALASQFPCHEADGNGDFQGQQRGNFQFDEDGCIDGDSDHVDSSDRGDGKDFHSTQIQSAQIDSIAHTITITGLGLAGGLPVSFVLVGVETGPTTPGWISLTSSDGYAVSGTLLSGSILLH